MIYFISSLPNDSFVLATTIFKKYSEGSLKDQNVPRSKRGVKAFPDLKGSVFKSFRALDQTTVHKILEEVCDGVSSIKEAIAQCNDIKALQRIQQCFLKITNCETWAEACQTFLHFTSAEKLEPFRRLNFSGSTAPEQFMRFCQQALKYTRKDLQDDTATSHHDNLFWLYTSNGQTIGILWKNNMLVTTPVSVAEVLSTVGSPHQFSGFQLAIFDLPKVRTDLSSYYRYSKVDYYLITGK